jgi:hypothetical protein
MPCKAVLKLLPALRLSKRVAGHFLHDRPERLLPSALKPLKLPVRDPSPHLALLLAHRVPRTHPPSLLLNLPKDLHILLVVEAVPPQLFCLGMHPVHRRVDVGMILVPMHRHHRLVPAQTPAL